MRLIRRTARAAVVAAAVLLFLRAPAPVSAAGPDEIVSIERRAFAAAGLARRGFDRLMEKDGRVYLVVSPGEMAALNALRVPFRVDTAGLERSMTEGLSAAGGINGAYHSTLELETDLRLLVQDHPGLAEVVEIGQSLEKRKILALKISDNAGASEGEPAVLFTGCHHAREWISVEVPFQFGKSLLEHYATDPDVRALVDASEIWIVPIVNPDGLEYSIHVYRYWRKNRRANAGGTFGVDVNRNYGTAWGYDNEGSKGYEGSEIYRGTGPFSEPETAAVRSLVQGAGLDLRAVISYHSYGQTILYPWGYTTDAAPDASTLATVAGTMAGLMAAVHGTVYTPGQASRTLYLTNGDTIDWTYSLGGAPSFTVELPPVDVDHGGFFNDEAAIAAVFEENLPAMLYLVRYAVDHPLAPRRLPPVRGDRVRGATSRPARIVPRPAPGPVR